MSEIHDFFVERATQFWTKWYGGLAIAVLLACAALTTIVTLPLGSMTELKWIIVGLVLVAVLLFWAISQRLPRARRGKIGVLVAIRCESNAQYKRLRTDFLALLRELLHDKPELHNLELVEFSAEQAESIRDRASAQRAMEKARCFFVLHGQVRERKIKGKDCHVLDVRGMVRHALLPKPVQQNLEHEFSSVMPSRVIIGRDNEIPAFDATSEWMDAAARYVLGLAALASRDLDYAETLLQDVRTRLCGRPSRNIGISLIAARINRPLGALFDARMRLAYTEYQSSHSVEDLSKVEMYAERIVEFDSSSYPARIALAFCAFELRGDVRTARVHLKKCLGVEDSAWKYSEAFLLAYEGKIIAARKLYRKAFSSKAGNAERAKECVAHIKSVVSREPQRYHLHYALALIQNHALNDLDAASVHARKYLSQAPMTEQPRERVFMEAILTSAARSVAALQPSVQSISEPSDRALKESRIANSGESNTAA